MYIFYQCDDWVKQDSRESARCCARARRAARRAPAPPGGPPAAGRAGRCGAAVCGGLGQKNVSSLPRGGLVPLRTVLGANVLCSIDPWCTSYTDARDSLSLFWRPRPSTRLGRSRQRCRRSRRQRYSWFGQRCSSCWFRRHHCGPRQRCCKRSCYRRCWSRWLGPASIYLAIGSACALRRWMRRVRRRATG